MPWDFNHFNSIACGWFTRGQIVAKRISCVSGWSWFRILSSCFWMWATFWIHGKLEVPKPCSEVICPTQFLFPWYQTIYILKHLVDFVSFEKKIPSFTKKSNDTIVHVLVRQYFSYFFSKYHVLNNLDFDNHSFFRSNSFMPLCTMTYIPLLCVIELRIELRMHTFTYWIREAPTPGYSWLDYLHTAHSAAMMGQGQVVSIGWGFDDNGSAIRIPYMCAIVYANIWPMAPLRRAIHLREIWGAAGARRGQFLVRVAGHSW